MTLIEIGQIHYQNDKGKVQNKNYGQVTQADTSDSHPVFSRGKESKAQSNLQDYITAVNISKSTFSLFMVWWG